MVVTFWKQGHLDVARSKETYSETSLSLQRNQAAQPAWGLAAEMVFSLPRSSVKVGLLVHASYKYVWPPLSPSLETGQQTDPALPPGSSELRWGKNVKGKIAGPQLGIKAASGSRAGRGHRVAGQVGVCGGPAPLGWPEKGPLTLEERFEGSKTCECLGTFTGGVFWAEATANTKGWAGVGRVAGQRPTGHEGVSRREAREGVAWAVGAGAPWTPRK